MSRTWDRIEPHTRDTELEEGLEGRLADPLWLLGRQWQVGEFRGEDAATPIHATLDVGYRPLESFRNDVRPGAPVEPLSSAWPLEARVEAAPLRGAGTIALAAEAGLAFLRRLRAEGLGALCPDLRRAFPLVIDGQVRAGLPESERLRLRLWARRALDGRALYSAPDAAIAALGSSEDEAAVLVNVAVAFRAEYAARFVVPGPSGDTWVDERLEYRFSLGARGPDGDLVLSAAQFAGGHLDWYSFDLDRRASASHHLASAPLVTRRLQLLPVPLAFAGMPASRFWEFEDDSVYFGGIEAGPADIGRLCVAEYGLVYSDDWFLLPVRLPIGSLAKVERLRVADTFGATHRVLPAAFHDAQRAREAGSGERPFVFFELSGDRSPWLETSTRLTPAREASLAPWLLLPPALVGEHDGKPLEEVAFVRDEAANLAWAIESTIEAPTGRPLRRRLLWGLAGEATASRRVRRPPDASGAPTEEAWRYRLQSPVPPYWIPLVPELVREGSSEVRLRRARMLAWDDIPQVWVKGPKGQLLTPEKPSWFFEEEITEAGLEVTRRFQLARSGRGDLVLWMARQKRPGRGERASGLDYDALERGPAR